MITSHELRELLGFNGDHELGANDAVTEDMFDRLLELGLVSLREDPAGDIKRWYCATKLGHDLMNAASRAASEAFGAHRLEEIQS